jgi:methylated-DNA-[protein]-cysteine S-methyltransferase
MLGRESIKGSIFHVKGMENANLAAHAFCIRSTPFGPVIIVWSVFNDEPRVARIFIPDPAVPAEDQRSTLFPDSPPLSCSEIDTLADDIEAFLGGGDVGFTLDIARMDLCSQFQKQVLYAEHGIPRGAVSTYERIAGFLGKPKAARAVGNALAKNPFPILVPCHRAIRSNRFLGGYQGGLEMKRRLLEMEGIDFDDLGRAIIETFFY